MRLRTIANTFARHWNDIDWWRKRNLVREIGMPFVFSMLRSGGVNVMKQDWDILVILDACRYDMFSELNSIEGNLQSRQSWNSATAQFLKANFTDEEYFDVVYVSANPKVSMTLDTESLFHDVVQVWESHWDEELNTVPPKEMVKATQSAAETYPNKRIVSHFVQPHFPFIGPKALEWFGPQGGFEKSRGELLDGDRDREYDNIWEQARHGTVSDERVETAYRENLEITLPHVQRIIDSVQGKVVVTSDHGNMIGERAWPFPVRIYGHPPYVLTEELIKVPWLVVNDENRRKIVSESPINDQTVNQNVANDRLKDLGYLD